MVEDGLSEGWDGVGVESNAEPTVYPVELRTLMLSQPLNPFVRLEVIVKPFRSVLNEQPS